ncbi:hypothetical protein [Mucilaginibacter phyllosphaerae]|uniref:Uncharacterized protein n=1 Tax=Mucilaginibacter phyllosphaerae TaxID=1812349 RepID=A0A4Y8AA11_9SPHI|nr:hypothetical protein [Mucilaginibacter phyllosphaerae]MBB3969916.1 hypothetical protein [Mucilaginibacter phyllosphaerae]TEW65290.1 hypothetical protein E2R65_15370 [Mucilaginibacter phyllosphaerae]GGH16816.1 hypothetical protein GCM10007352_26470 [Mucilaginibacter phyllosphaerae]
MNTNTSLTTTVSNEILNTSLDVGIDYAELGFDDLLNDGVLKEIPVIKTLISIAKIGINVKEKFFIKKLLTFLKELHSGGALSDKSNDFKNKFGSDSKYREKVTEQIMIFLDAHLTIEKSKILAKLFTAHVEGKFDWNHFVNLSTCLNSLYPQSFDFLKQLSNTNFKIPLSPERDSLGLSRDLNNEALLNSSGLAYDASPWDSAFEVGKLGQDLYNYGIK